MTSAGRARRSDAVLLSCGILPTNAARAVDPAPRGIGRRADSACQPGTASARRAPANHVDDDQQDDRADHRDEKARQAEIALVDRSATDQRRNEPAAQQGADDPDDDVEEEALLRVGLHDEAGYPTDDAAYDQPDDEIHLELPDVTNVGASRCFAPCAGHRDDAHSAVGLAPTGPV